MLLKERGFAQSEKSIVLPRGSHAEKVRKASEGKGREQRLSVDDWQVLEKECQASRKIWLYLLFSWQWKPPCDEVSYCN